MMGPPPMWPMLMKVWSGNYTPLGLFKCSHNFISALSIYSSIRLFNIYLGIHSFRSYHETSGDQLQENLQKEQEGYSEKTNRVLVFSPTFL